MCSSPISTNDICSLCEVVRAFLHQRDEFIYPSIHPKMYLSSHSSICPSIYPFIHHSSIPLSINASIHCHPSIHQLIHPSIHPSIPCFCQVIHPSSICPSIYPFTHHPKIPLSMHPFILSSIYSLIYLSIHPKMFLSSHSSIIHLSFPLSHPSTQPHTMSNFVRGLFQHDDKQGPNTGNAFI